MLTNLGIREQTSLQHLLSSHICSVSVTLLLTYIQALYEMGTHYLIAPVRYRGMATCPETPEVFSV
jgi:hypothetical protein